MIVHGPFPPDPRVARAVAVAVDRGWEVDVLATRQPVASASLHEDERMAAPRDVLRSVDRIVVEIGSRLSSLGYDSCDRGVSRPTRRRAVPGG